MITKSISVNSEIVLNVTRLLVLLSRFSNQKSIKTTIDKIMLYDFYMKYPNIMLEDKELSGQLSYYDYYSYYHWKPDRNEYQLYLSYMIAKGIITRTIKSNDFIYTITDSGSSIVESLQSNYAQSLFRVADYIRKNLPPLNDTKVENEIIIKSANKKQAIHRKGILDD